MLVDMEPGHRRRVRIERIHMEQDAGKSIHDMDPAMSFVDLNRTGVALMEIVSRPDIRGPEEAAAYITKLRQILRYLGTCDGNMQSATCAPMSTCQVCRPGAYEKYRTARISPSGHPLRDQEHELDAVHPDGHRSRGAAPDRHPRIGRRGRAGNPPLRPDRGETRSMRSKEEAHDYRYFPDPDLLPLEIEQDWVDAIAASPSRTSRREKGPFCQGIRAERIRRRRAYRRNRERRLFRAGPKGRDGKQVANWVINDLFGRLKKEGHGDFRKPREPRQLGGIVDLIASDAISGKIAKDLFEIVYTEGGDPAKIVEERGMKQVTDTGAIEAAVDEIIAANPAQVEKARPTPSSRAGSWAR